MRIDRLYPLFEGLPLGLVLPRVLPLDFQHKYCAVGQPDKEVGPVLVHDTFVDVEDLEAPVVVLHSGGDMGIVVDERDSLACLPGAVVDVEVDVGLLRALAKHPRVPGTHVVDGPGAILQITEQPYLLGQNWLKKIRD